MRPSRVTIAAVVPKSSTPVAWAASLARLLVILPLNLSSRLKFRPLHRLCLFSLAEMAVRHGFAFLTLSLSDPFATPPRPPYILRDKTPVVKTPDTNYPS